MPPLLPWLAHFTLPSVAAIVATYSPAALDAARGARPDDCRGCRSPPRCRAAADASRPASRSTAVVAAGGLGLDRPLGLPTFVAGAVVAIVVLASAAQSPVPCCGDISWGVLPLVAGLFMLVEGVDRTGVLRRSRRGCCGTPQPRRPERPPWAPASIVAFASQPDEQSAGRPRRRRRSQSADVPRQVDDALLIGVDLGPNLR